MKITIEGVPPKKDRPRFVSGMKSPVSTTNTKKGEQRVKLAFCLQLGYYIEPISTACKVVINAYYTPPKSWSKKKQREAIGKYKITKPDTDNVIKSILDGLNELAYKDDNLVAVVECCKRYAERDYTDVEIIRL